MWPLALLGLLAWSRRAEACGPCWLLGVAAVARHRSGGSSSSTSGAGRRPTCAPTPGSTGSSGAPSSALLFARRPPPPRSSPGGRRSPSPSSGSCCWAWVRADGRLGVLRRHHALGAVCRRADRPPGEPPRPVLHGTGRASRRSAVGRVSYALYLWQLPVLRAVERWTPDLGRRLAHVAALARAARRRCTLGVVVPRRAAALCGVKRRLQARWRAEPPSARRAASPAERPQRPAHGAVGEPQRALEQVVGRQGLLVEPDLELAARCRRRAEPGSSVAWCSTWSSIVK